MDGRKVQAILIWPTPTKVPNLTPFLGSENYYHRFIKGYSKKIAPLTNLLKKDEKWVWTRYFQEAFDKPKQVVVSELVLHLTDFEKSFEVDIDASDKAIGVVPYSRWAPHYFRKLEA